MSLEVHEELLKRWPEFYTFACEALKSHGCEDSSSAEESALFLNLMQSRRFELYEECGFSTKLSEKLDKLIKKTEQFCLLNIVNLYDTFQEQTMVKRMSSCTVNLKRIDGLSKRPVKTSKGKNKVAQKRNNSTMEHTPTTDMEAEQELASPNSQELGRGKRQKKIKLKFEFSEESTFSYKANATPTQHKIPSASKRLCHTEPPRRKNAINANEEMRDIPNKAVANANRTTGASPSLKDLVPVRGKIRLNSTKTTQFGKEDLATPKGPGKLKSGTSPRATKTKADGDVELDMSVDVDLELTSEADPGQATHTPVIDIKAEGDSKREPAEISMGTADQSESEKEGSTMKAKDAGCSCAEELTPKDVALKQEDSTKRIRVKKARGPQKAPKKVPWKKVPVVCSRCKTRFAAYSTLRRHWARVHSTNRQFDFINPPKLLLCTVCGEEFSFPHLYLRHYRAHAADISSDQECTGPQATGLDGKPGSVEIGGRSKNGTLEAEGTSAGDDHQQSAVAKDDEQTEKLIKSESQKDGVDQEGLTTAVSTKEAGTEDSSGDVQEEKTNGEIEDDGSDGNALTSRRSKKGRGPQKTPKKFPWSLVPIVCSMCKMRYSTYSTLRRHWTKVHSTNKVFDRLNPPKLLLCTVCDETFSWPRQFLKHYREHAAGQELALNRFRPVKFIGERSDFPCDKLVPITCSVCKTVIIGDGVIYSHWKKEHRTEDQQKPPPLFYCDLCGLTFDAPRKFKLHYRIHTGAKPHECETCQKTFRTFSDLTSHMLCHNQSKEFKCEICGKAFIAQKVLNRHMKGHLFPCVCDICGKSYPSKYSLNLHTKIHTGEKPHKCEFCGVAFIQAGSLKLHRRLHLGDKPHVCETCGMRFNSMSHLRTHIRVHTGEKPYKCDKCPYAAASTSRLKDHATVHRDEKPHVCKVPGCGRRYKRLSHLIFHHSKHAGIKPYVCKICGMAFKLSSALSLHKRQDACAMTKEEQIKSEWSEDQPKEAITDYNLLVTTSEDTIHVPVDRAEEMKEDHQTVYIYHDIKDGLQEVGDAAQQIAGVEGASHTELVLDGGQEDFEQQIVIQIVREPGQEDEDIVLSKEELERIVRLSQQM